MKAVKKPVIIDYYPVDIKSSENLISWIRSFGDNENDILELDNGFLKVKTLEGTSYFITNDDVVIRGIKGEYYPCKIDIFEKTYERLENETNKLKNLSLEELQDKIVNQ